MTLADGTKLLGRRITSQTNPDNGVLSFQYKTANRELDPRREDFHWVAEDAVRRVEYPAGVVVLERAENGDFYGFLKDLQTPTLEVPAAAAMDDRFHAALAAVSRQRGNVLEPLAARARPSATRSRRFAVRR